MTTSKPEDTEIWTPVPPVVSPGTVMKPGASISAPGDAVVLFDGKDMSAWDLPENTEWLVKDEIVSISPSAERRVKPVWIFSRRSFGNIQLHLEWRAPRKVEGAGQRRGNSGVFLPGRYEVQILDSYQNLTYVNGQCGSIYKQTGPLVNACRKPGEWQTYDIVYKAPRFSRDGRLKSAGRVTLLHNGVLVLNHVKIKGGTTHIGYPRYTAHPLKQPVGLQDHGDAVSFRNIWLREL